MAYIVSLPSAEGTDGPSEMTQNRRPGRKPISLKTSLLNIRLYLQQAGVREDGQQQSKFVTLNSDPKEKHRIKNAGMKFLSQSLSLHTQLQPIFL